MVNRLARIAGPALLLVVSFVALLAALAYGGGADAPIITDPGAVVRYGLPIAKLVVNIGAAGTIGALVLAVFALAADKPEYGRALDVAAGASALWTVASAATGFLIFLSIYNQPVSFDDRFGDLLSSFMTTTELGQAWLATTLIAAALTVLCFAVRHQTAIIFVTILAIAGMIPMSLQGHAGDQASHESAITAVYLHIVFAAIWLGGLLTIILLRPALEGRRLLPVLQRYSTLALISFIVVAASGYVSAEIRLATIPNLLTPYGILVLVKVFALGALGLFGIFQRRFLIGRMASSETGGRGAFWWLITAEIAFMGLASGVAAALARTVTPQVEVAIGDITNPSAAELLTNRALPPAPTFENFFTQWNFDLLWILLCAFAIFFYIAGVVRLHRRGDRWPLHRTILWVAGIVTLFYITNGGINLYEKYLFSAHMLGHMVLGMMVPVLLVPGAPITLALRAIKKRSDGSRGPREWIMLLVHSRYFAVLANPIVAAIIFAGSLWVFYYTPLFSWATTDHIGHIWMIVHFVGAGYLFVQSLIGIDPSPYRAPYPMRLLVLLGTMAFHAFFGLTLMSGSGLLLADWYGAMGWDIGISAIEDQQRGGGIAWGVGELPTIALAIAVAFMWARSDGRESKRYDRKADRDGDAELEEYNAMLAKRASRVPQR
ncbi:MAG: copper transporter [Glaciihabitans sp.]|nr:copper transporter [Glaciihabitans sp.]